MNIRALVLLAWLLPLAVAQASLSQLPTCALNCLVASTTGSVCTITNQTCLCTDAHYQTTVTACIVSNCTAFEMLTAKNITATNCNTPIRDKSGVFVTTSNVLAVFSNLFLIMRLGYRWFIARAPLAADDWSSIAAIIIGIPGAVINVQGLAPNGVGKDVWTLTTTKIYHFGKFFFIMEVLYFANIVPNKLTLLFFYLRIFPSKGVRRLLWGTIAFTVVVGVVFVLLAIFQCHPISHYWTRWDGGKDGTCLSVNAIGWANAAISIATDVWMLVIPLVQLRKLRLHWKKKIGVALMFSVGTFVTVVSILRLQSLLSFANSLNPTWEDFPVAMWSTIEINVGIICACLPSFRLLLVHFFPRMLGSTNHQSYYNDRAYYNNGSRPTGGASGNRGPRSIPLVSTSGQKNSNTHTTVSCSRKADDDDDFVTDPPKSAPPSDNPGGIMYSTSYSVEYNSEYHDQARLVQKPSSQQLHPHAQQPLHSHPPPHPPTSGEDFSNKTVFKDGQSDASSA